MGRSLRSLLDGVKEEVNVVFGKKKNLFDMTDDELSKQSLEKLVQYYDILGHSLIEMVKKGKLNKMKILNVFSATNLADSPSSRISRVRTPNPSNSWRKILLRKDRSSTGRSRSSQRKMRSRGLR